MSGRRACLATFANRIADLVERGLIAVGASCAVVAIVWIAWEALR